MNRTRSQVVAAFLLLLGFSVGAGCNDRALSPAPNDGAPSNAAADLAHWTPVPCVDGTCGPNQVCVYPCGPALPCDMAGGSGTGSCTQPPFCFDLPSSCRSHLTCGCFPTDPCWYGDNLGTCRDIQNGIVSCGMCPI